MFVTTLVDHRPDFLVLQKKSFDKFISVSHDFVPLVNSFSHSRTLDNFEAIHSLGLNGLRVRRALSIEMSNRRPAFGLRGYLDPAMACAFGMEWFWRKILPKLENEFLLFLDSDMFFISDFDPATVLGTKSFAFIPQYRGHIVYPYAGFFLARVKSRLYEEFSWFPGRVDGFNTDVGGRAHMWCKENLESENIRELLMISIRNVITQAMGLRIQSQINGNFNFTFDFNELTGESKVVSSDDLGEISAFWKSKSPKTELEWVASETTRLFLAVKDFGWPKPHYFDFIGVRETAKFEPFIFHYKSGSNYQPWSTADYNQAKTKALCEYALGSG